MTYLYNLVRLVLPSLICVAALLFAGAAAAQTNVTGQWSKLQNLPEYPVHSVLLPNGKVLMWGRNKVERIWDPVTQAVTLLPHAGFDLFCAGHAVLADGRVLIAGGHVADFVGLPNATIFNPATNSWTPVPNMNAGRWYPTVTALPNGDALVVSGQMDTSTGANPLPQVYQAATNTWRDLTGAQMQQGLYPIMFVAPNGKLIDVAPTHVTRYLDTTGSGTWSMVGFRKMPWRDYGTAVMYADGKVLVAGGIDPPTATAEVIDLNVATPAWRLVPSMQYARRHLNSTLLPDGTVLVTGGTSGPGHNNASTAVFAAELWNPSTETWTTLASATVPRLYHSSAMLLPDGRVMTTGGDNYTDVEIFSPPYMFKGASPTITGAPASVGYGQQFTVQSPEGADIRKVTMIRLGSPTHAFDMGQRMNTLQFTPGTGVVNITTPANSNLAPPGHYMLFIMNSAGVPSQARIVQLGSSTTQPPPPTPPAMTVSSLSPNSAAAGGPAFTLNVAGSNFAQGAVVRWNSAARTTTFASTSQLTAAIPATDIAAAGTAQISVLNPGGAVSGNLSFTVTSPVTPAPAGQSFTLSVSRQGNATGKGVVTSSPAGISCGTACAAAYPVNATVTLTASANGNAVFTGWSGACSGTSLTCTVKMDASKTATANFNRR